MPGRLTTLVKGTFCGSTDATLQAATKAALKQWLKEFENPQQGLKDIAIAHGVFTAAEGKHYDEFFLNGAGAFFPEISEDIKADVVRGAFIQGLRTSIYSSFPGTERPEPKPIVMYWIAGGPAFEAYVSDSVAEVHIVLLTPDPTPELKPPADPTKTRDEPIWLVASAGRVQAIRDRGPNYAYKAVEPLPPGLAAVCQQIKSY